jgi:hypothetical protein
VKNADRSNKLERGSLDLTNIAITGDFNKSHLWSDENRNSAEKTKDETI